MSADLSGDRSTSDHAELQSGWFRLMEIAGVPREQHANMIQAWQSSVGFLPVADLEALIASAGFERPVLFSQSLLIRAWFAHRLA